MAAKRIRSMGVVLFGLLLGASASAQGQPGPTGFPLPARAPDKAPNVIVIMTDDVGYASGTTFGGEIPTPTMDRLAEAGLRYSNFHTTGICSPSRAALLTGRNHHAVSTGTVTDLARGLPGYTSIIPKSAATLAHVLKANGYDTAAFGKNHNIPSWQSGPAGPFDQWMTGLGFDYFYGFHGGHTDQFAPMLVENTSMIPTPAQEGYVLDRDLADRAVRWLQMQRTQSGGRPFFVYYAPGSAHAPLQAPAEWIARFRGKFDDGWDAMRIRVFERQKRLGVIPADARLAPLPPEVPQWNSLSPERQRTAARLMEAYAGALAYCDDQMGRMIEELRASGQLDNTLVVYIQGDNGATPEGGEQGTINYAGRAAPAAELAHTLDRLDEIGGPNSYPVAPLGWMMAMNTPFPHHKVIASRLGGIRNGMVVSWPARLAARGVRKQFTHLVDVMPTVLEAAGIKLPASHGGVRQQPLDGISFAYSFVAPEAAERHRRQYFEVFGNAALYEDGWFVASPVQPLGRGNAVAPADAAKWQLYDLRSDPTQTEDLADRQPAQLARMRRAFDAEARRNQVLPISSDSLGALLPQSRPEVTAAAGSFTFYPSAFRYSEGTFPSINNRSWTLAAEVTASGDGDQGALVTQGGRFSGWGLVLLKGVPTFLYRTSDTPASLTRLAAPATLSPGPHRITVSFTVDGPGLGRGGTLAMAIDGKPVASGRLERSVVVKFSPEDAVVGHDVGTPLTDDYALPFASAGLRSVTIDLKPVQFQRSGPAGP